MVHLVFNSTGGGILLAIIGERIGYEKNRIHLRLGIEPGFAGNGMYSAAAEAAAETAFFGRPARAAGWSRVGDDPDSP